MSWTITVDSSACAGSGLCASLAPTHFVYAASGSTVTASPIDPDDDVLAAAECCPMEAIRITKVETGEAVFG